MLKLSFILAISSSRLKERESQTVIIAYYKVLVTDYPNLSLKKEYIFLVQSIHYTRVV